MGLGIVRSGSAGGLKINAPVFDVIPENAVNKGDVFLKDVNFNKLLSSSFDIQNSPSGCCMSMDGAYLAVGGRNSSSEGYLSVYKRNGNDFVKLPDISIEASSNPRPSSMIADGAYLAVMTTNTNLRIYKRNGDSFVNLINGLHTDSSNIYDCKFSADGTCLVAACATSPFVAYWKRGGDVFTKLTNPQNTYPAIHAKAVFSYDAALLFVSINNFGNAIYKRSGGQFALYKSDAPFSANSTYLSADLNGNSFAAASSVSPFITVYNKSADFYISLENSDGTNPVKAYKIT